MKENKTNGFKISRYISFVTLIFSAIAHDYNVILHKHWNVLYYSALIIINIIIIAFDTKQMEKINRSNDSIKITNVPRINDSNKIIKYVFDKKFGSVCPYCGENKKWTEYINTSFRPGTKGITSRRYEDDYKGKFSYNINSDDPFAFITNRCNKYSWRVSSFKCYTCGTEWKSPAYPNSDDNNDIIIDDLYRMFDYINWDKEIVKYKSSIIVDKSYPNETFIHNEGHLTTAHSAGCLTTAHSYKM